jgi:hypothetical protein
MKVVPYWNNEPFLISINHILSEQMDLFRTHSVSGIKHRFHDGPVSLLGTEILVYFSSESFNDDLYENKARNVNTAASKL